MTLAIPTPLLEGMVCAIANTIGIVSGEDLVAIDLIYHAMEPGDIEPAPVDVFGCSRSRRDELLQQEPPPSGLVYIWSNLEFDHYADPEASDRLLGPVWQQVNDFAQQTYRQGVPVEDPDYTHVPRSVLLAVCRDLNEGRWPSARPSRLTADAVVFPAARGGVDPDTADNLRVALTTQQKEGLEAAGMLLPY